MYLRRKLPVSKFCMESGYFAWRLNTHGNVSGSYMNMFPFIFIAHFQLVVSSPMLYFQSKENMEQRTPSKRSTSEMLDASQSSTPTKKQASLRMPLKGQSGASRHLTPSKKQTDLSTTPSKNQRPHATQPLTPSKRPQIGLAEFGTQLELFHKEVETKFKAVMYDLTAGNTADATCNIQNMMQQSRNFVSSSLPVLEQIKLRSSALEQKISCVESYNLHLHRENNDLRRKLEQYRGLASCFDEEFDDEMSQSVTKDEDSSSEANSQATTYQGNSGEACTRDQASEI